MNVFSFEERLRFSNMKRGRSFESIIMDMIPGAREVQRTSVEVDKTGVDYIASICDGTQVNIDLKLRGEGCSKYWSGDEELALETWSVKPSASFQGKVGWTLDRSKRTHYTLHAFDPKDSDRVFILPFQLLRAAFEENAAQFVKKYRVETQQSETWKSQCVFVPSSVVIKSIEQQMMKRVRMYPPCPQSRLRSIA